MATSQSHGDFMLDWYNALYSGNFLLLREMLRDRPFLWKFGPRRDPTKTVKRLNVDGPETSTWKGSSAFLEAATFGCADLVKLCFELGNVPTISSSSPPVDTGLGPIESTPDESGIADPSREDAAVEVDVSADAQKNGSDAGLGAKFRKALWTGPKRGVEHMFKGRSTGQDNAGAETDEKNGGQNPTLPNNVRELLLVKSGWWGVDAITIAVVCGSNEVLGLLVHALGQCKDPPEWIKQRTKSQPQGLVKPRTVRELQGSVDSGDMGWLREVTKDVLADPDCEECGRVGKEMYSGDPHLNFLPIEEYLFHFLCQQSNDDKFRAARMAMRKKMGREHPLGFVLTLKDSQGRPPFHAAIWSGTTDTFFDLIQTENEDVMISRMILAIKTLDGAGRTPVHLAAALGRTAALETILLYAHKNDVVGDVVSQTCKKKWQYQKPDFSGGEIPIDINKLSKELGFGYHHGPYSAVHAALLHGNSECAKLLIEQFPEEDWGTYIYTREPCEKIVTKAAVIIEFDTVELACLMGADVSVIRLLLAAGGRGGYLGQSKPFSVSDQSQSPKIYTHPWHALHIAAASGKYDNLQLLLKDDLFAVEDFQGNSALHHALRVHEFGFQTHLVDHIELEGVRDNIRSHAAVNKAKEFQDSAELTQTRQDCIDLLLQRGCDIFAENHFKNVPYPGQVLENNGKLMSWWSENQTKALQAAANDCVNAANAISVTAALVATTSYVGPLTPPLSYGDHGIHDNNVFVIIFMVCDTMSFYLAIAAITISLIPSLPAGWQVLQRKPYTGRDMVTLSVTILFPAIVLLFIAFACSSLSVATANVTSTVAGQLTLATTCIGGCICLLAFILFSIRLVVFILPRNDYLSILDDWSKFSLAQSKSKSKSKKMAALAL